MEVVASFVRIMMRFCTSVVCNAFCSRKGNSFRLCSADSLRSKWVGNFNFGFGLTDSRLLNYYQFGSLDCNFLLDLALWIVSHVQNILFVFPPRAFSVHSWMVLGAMNTFFLSGRTISDTMPRGRSFFTHRFGVVASFLSVSISLTVSA